ncbi:MAG: hypothetical protein M3N93_14375 [Acidobacteriota bacterium]|nr:hypothetical protein [Acidobacteriota bacterium]
MKTKLIAGLLLAGSCLFAAPRISIDVGVGAPVGGYYAPAPVYGAPVYAAPAYAAPAYAPPRAPFAEAIVAPGPGCTWVNGYWFAAGPRRVWRAGYWARRDGYFEPRARFRRY